MAPSAQAHQRSHSLLLLQKLFNLRDSASPLTLILDSLEQPAKPLIEEFTTRAKLAQTKIIFVSLSTLKPPSFTDIFIRARGKSLQAISTEILSHIPKPSTQKTLLLLDTLHPLLTPTNTPLLPAFITTLLPHPSISLILTYHLDIPAPTPAPYTPHPLTLLTHLATCVLRIHNLSQTIASHRAAQRSLPSPLFGLSEGREGLLVGLLPREKGVVLEMELRRRSGRAVAEKFILVPADSNNERDGKRGGGGGRIMVLGDHPVFARTVEDDEQEGGEDAETTFSLGLTEKQRRDREGVVLPYFDAQTEVGGGEGGRILYEMGREDDFDDEEDEI
ncbi:hypothetical protein OQA88_6159 [Cercophora sp. LCS_1]